MFEGIMVALIFGFAVGLIQVFMEWLSKAPERKEERERLKKQKELEKNNE